MRAAEFSPPRLLRNRHLQSVLASSAVRRLLYLHRRRMLDSGAEAMLLDAGDGVRLQGFHTRQQAQPVARGLVIMLHGWEGCAQSSYLLHTGSRMLAEGFDVFRLNFRDHGDSHHLNRELFHSCRIDEVVGAVKAVSEAIPLRPLFITGFALGGNFSLRVALRAPAAGIPLDYALAVCPVISPAHGLEALERAPWFYEQYFLMKWRKSLKRKRALFPEDFTFSDAELKADLRGLSRWLVERYTDFGSLENYLDGYSIAGDRLKHLAVPATVLTAADDPVIPVSDFQALELSPLAELEITPYGGFIRDFRLRSWIEDYMAAKFLGRA
ncbi:MAG TPA: alpha/beta fold hydrolase [Xanthomonadaceae bacterium]|nr:alpha/beta fold hydrolase [Xanthomonadaceae bacterium]